MVSTTLAAHIYLIHLTTRMENIAGGEPDLTQYAFADFESTCLCPEVHTCCLGVAYYVRDIAERSHAG